MRRRFWDAMRTRFEQFGLELHGEKTRLLEFGRYAAAATAATRDWANQRPSPSWGSRSSAASPGAEHSCSSARPDAIACGRSSKEVKEQLRERMHDCHSRTGAMAASGGHGLLRVPRGAHEHPGTWRIPPPRHSTSGDARCGGAARRIALTWERMERLAADWLPLPRILHPWPDAALRRHSPKVGAVCPNRARTDLCGGCPAMGIPTAIGSFLCLLGTWMFSSRRKEPPPSTHPFNTVWDIAGAAQARGSGRRGNAMIASRSHQHAERQAVNTACPPRRSAGSSQAPTDRRRGQACTSKHQPTIAFGAVLPTPAIAPPAWTTRAASRPSRTPEIR